MSDQASNWPHPDIPPPPPLLEQPRRGNSFIYASPRNQRDIDVWAAERHVRDNWTYQQIADALGYANKGTAYYTVARGLREPNAEREKRAAETREIARARLELLHEAALGVMGRKHITVSHGRIIMVHDEDTGEEVPLIDDGPTLQAIDRLLRINESVRKLDGLDAAAKVDTNVTVAAQDTELAQLIAQTEAKNAAKEAQLKRGDTSE